MITIQSYEVGTKMSSASGGLGIPPFIPPEAGKPERLNLGLKFGNWHDNMPKNEEATWKQRWTDSDESSYQKKFVKN